MSKAHRTIELTCLSSLDRYKEYEFAGRIGFGRRPALLIIDLACAWTLPHGPFYCPEVESLIPEVSRLLDTARKKKVLTVFTVTAYENSLVDAGIWIRKIPALRHLVVGSDLCEIDSRIPPNPDELVIVKKRASAYAGTTLAGVLAGHSIDTLIICGVSTSGCVRHTAEDCIASGIRPVVVREAVGDRIPGATAWNLAEIDAKIGDVESIQSVISYLTALESVGTGSGGTP